MAQAVRKSGLKEVPLSVVKDDLSRFLREAGKQEIVITRHGKPAGVLIGFESKTIGSNIDSKPTLVFFAVSKRRGRACAWGEVFDWKT